jgi:hypothetical protein
MAVLMPTLLRSIRVPASAGRCLSGIASIQSKGCRQEGQGPARHNH